MTDLLIAKASGRKCNRCWIYKLDVGEGPTPFEDICNRCFLALEHLYITGQLDSFYADNGITESDIESAFSYLKEKGRTHISICAKHCHPGATSLKHNLQAHLYATWFDDKGQNFEGGYGEPWDEQGPILEQQWAMEEGYVEDDVSPWLDAELKLP